MALSSASEVSTKSSVLLGRGSDFDTAAHEAATSCTHLSKVHPLAHLLRYLQSVVAIAAEVSKAEIGLLLGYTFRLGVK